LPPKALEMPGYDGSTAFTTPWLLWRTARAAAVLPPENTAFSAEVRQLIYGKPSYAFRILFTIDCEVVRVLRVRRGRRLPVGAN